MGLAFSFVTILSRPRTTLGSYLPPNISVVTGLNHSSLASVASICPRASAGSPVAAMGPRANSAVGIVSRASRFRSRKATPTFSIFP